jgi:hypothetical protein
MESCGLSALGLCDKEAAQYRYATESWCASVSLNPEQLLKVKGKPLCKTHATHPDRINNPATPSPPAKKHKTDSTTSPLSPHLLQSPAARPKMKDAVAQTEENKPQFSPCLGTNNTDLEKFIESKYGYTYPDEDGYPWGEKLRGWTTFRARSCGRVARSKEATRCNDCNSLFVAMSSARTRHTHSEKKGTQKFTPLSALKVSPYVKSLLEKYKKENTESQTNQTPKTDEEIEVEVCLPILDITV